MNAPAITAPILRLDNTGTAPWGRPLLQGISFQLEPGHILALAGPNGAGKSTLLRLLSGELPAVAGSVEFRGQPPGAWPARERATSLAFLSQMSPLAFPFTVEEVVMLGRTPHGCGRVRDREVAIEAMRMTDTLPLRDRLYTRLSGGEKQRTQVARVLAQVLGQSDLQGCLLLLDEPTAALDLAHQQQVLAAVRAMADRGCAAVLVVHDLNLAASAADRILILHHGRQVDLGPAEAVLTPALFRDVFGVVVDIARHPRTGLPFITPDYGTRV